MPSRESQPLPPSLYADTARAAPPVAPLAGPASTRVVIVGGGFTGLSTALHLAESGVDALLVEANEPGWGASGRNGGQVNPGLKWEPETLEATFGADLGARMVRLGATAPDLVFDLVARLGVDCEANRGGTIRAAKHAAAEAGLRQFERQWRARGAEVELLDRAGMAAATGCDAYSLGVRDPRGGNLNPLGYARGLAEAALAAGARIVCGTRALALVRSGDCWTLTTDRGDIRAERVVISTNGYTDDLWPGLRRSVVPVYSSIAATEPLPPALVAAIMPGRPSLYEMSSTHAYYRVDALGRFLMGGRGVLRSTTAMHDYRRLTAYAIRLFPALHDARWTHCWNGRTAMTWDHLPHIHEPESGLSIGLGYNGRGVAMATAMGRMLARRAAGGDAADLDLPVTRVSPIWGHAAWPLAVKARLSWERLSESLGL